MRYGFKAFSERKSAEVRQALGLPIHKNIDAREFARSQGFIVWGPQDVPGLDESHVVQLLRTDPNSWSGVTVRVGSSAAIIVNTTHPSGRQANTIMHEWSHVELNHKPSRVDDFGNGLLLLSDYPKDFEEEADWLAASVLLPREALLSAKLNGQSDKLIADTYGVSLELVSWRLRMTAISKQISARNRQS